MTSTSVSATASATSTACGGSSLLYDIPTKDASCAMPFGGNHTDIMTKCCGSADVVSYYNNCGLYCLAQGQSVADLTSCLYKEGAAYQDVFCNANTTASATGSATDLPPTASASVIATGGSGGAKTSGGTASGSGSAPTSTTSGNAAAPNSVPSFGNGLTGLAIGALLFSATAFGALGL